jgi:hypothetical protein
METTTGGWQKRFKLRTCAAAEVEKEIPATVIGVAVIYATTPEKEQIFLIVESRAGSLRSQCLKRLQSAKLPPLAELSVSFVGETPGEASPEALNEACRRQVVLAAEMRRELRPAMR